jgi:hypothetical protein
MLTVHIETLKTLEKDAYGRIPHTVEVTIGKDRRAVPCYPMNRDGKLHSVTVYGLAVRFSSGDKVWPGSATYWAETGNVNNLTPNIDRRGYFSLVGYIEDFADKNSKSRHNSI